MFPVLSAIRRVHSPRHFERPRIGGRYPVPSLVSILLEIPIPSISVGTLTLTLLLLLISVTALFRVVLGSIRLTEVFSAVLSKWLLASKVIEPLRFTLTTVEAGESTLSTLGLFPGFLHSTIIILLVMTPLLPTVVTVLLLSPKYPVGFPRRTTLGVIVFPPIMEFLLVRPF